MRISLKLVYSCFFFLGIFFIPFNSYEGISFLGEYRKEGSIVFFIMSILLFFTDVGFSRKIKLPLKNIYIQFIILFLIWILISATLNSFSIYENYIKQTSGFNRLVRQLISLLVVLLVFVTAYNIFLNYGLKRVFLKIRKAFLVSFLVVCIYSFFEILIVVFDVSFLKPYFTLFDYFPFVETSLDFLYARISSVSHEPPFLAIFLITIAGWMFSYILTSKGLKSFLPTLFIFVITFFSGSRTALIVVLIQFLSFVLVAVTVNKKFLKLIQRLFVFLLISSFIVFLFNSKKISNEFTSKLNSLNFKKNLTKSVSNQSRIGIQYTSLLIFLEHPITGVGYGQQAYKARNMYPKWATHKNYEFKYYYLNDKDKSFPPGYNLYTRLLAETGMIGFLIFTSFLFIILLHCKRIIKRKNSNEKIIAITLFVSFIGFVINWLQFDSFRSFGFWICLALLMQLTQVKKSTYE